MTLTILVSVSLLALVSSARPLPGPEEQRLWRGLQGLEQQLTGSGEDRDIQQVMEVVRAHVRISQDVNPNESSEERDIFIQLASLDQVQAYLSSSVQGNAVKTVVVPIENGKDGLRSPDEKELYQLLSQSGDVLKKSRVLDDMLDAEASLASASSTLLDAQSDAKANFTVSEANDPERIDTFDASTAPFHLEGSYSQPIVVLAVSCAIALLVVCCIGTALYIAESVRKNVYVRVWDVLPKLEIQKRSVGGTCAAEKDLVVDGELDSESKKIRMPATLALTRTTGRGLHGTDAGVLVSSGNETSDDEDDVNEEKYFDAESQDGDTDASVFSTVPIQLSPGLPALAVATATAAAVAVAHHTPSVTEAKILMREAGSGSMTSAGTGPGSRPSWSVRAAEAGALVHAHDNLKASRNDELNIGVECTQPRTGRRGMFAMPELDAALAMQLRPGLGTGADAAWLVRFVMALFGWCAVMMSGGRKL